MRFLIMLSLMPGLLGLAFAQSPTVLRELRVGANASIVATVEPDALRKENLATTIRSLLKDGIIAEGFRQFALFTDKHEADEFMQAKQVTFKTGLAWFRKASQVKPPHGDAALVLAAPMGIMVRLRTRGEYSRLVLKGSDPARLNVEHVHADVLLISFATDIPLFRNDPIRKNQVYAFLRTSTMVNEEEGLHLTRSLAALMDTKNLMVDIRPDMLFIYSQRFPLVYPFEPFPKKDNVLSGPPKVMGCSLDPRGASCMELP